MESFRTGLELAEDPQGEAPVLPAPGHLYGFKLVGAPELLSLRGPAVYFILHVSRGDHGVRRFHFMGPESATDQIKAPAHLPWGYTVLHDQ